MLFIFNKEISVTTLDIAMKLCKTILHFYFEGSVSQILYLGPHFDFM